MFRLLHFPISNTSSTQWVQLFLATTLLFLLVVQVEADKPKSKWRDFIQISKATEQREGKSSYSEGSARLLERFGKLHQNFKDLKDELGYKEGKKINHTPPGCALTGDCIWDFRQDNITSSFEWYRNFPFPENFPIRKHHYDADEIEKPLLIATVKNKKLKRNQHSILTTDVPIKKSKQCIDFYYYMFSDDGCDAIRFSVTLKCENHLDEVIIKTSGTKKKDWQYVLFDVEKPIGTKCQIQWKAAKGLSEDGKVGIDDVNIHYEPCPTQGRIFSTRLGCSFHKGFCLWGTSGELTWTPGKHEILSRSENYVIKQESSKIFVNNSKTILHPNKSAVLTSPIAYNTHPKCLTFKWLKIADNFTYNPGNLTVSFIKANLTEQAWVDNYDELLAKDKGKRMVPWNLAMVDLPRKQEFKAEIKFHTNPKGALFFTAICEMRVLDGECEVHQIPTFHQAPFQTKKKKNKRKQRRSSHGKRRNPDVDFDQDEMNPSVENLDEKGNPLPVKRSKVGKCFDCYEFVILVLYLFEFKKYLF